MVKILNCYLHAKKSDGTLSKGTSFFGKPCRNEYLNFIKNLKQLFQRLQRVVLKKILKIRIENTAPITDQRRKLFCEKKLFVALYYSNKGSYEPSRNLLHVSKNDSTKINFNFSRNQGRWRQRS